MKHALLLLLAAATLTACASGHPATTASAPRPAPVSISIAQGRLPQTVRTISVQSAWDRNGDAAVTPPAIASARVQDPATVRTIVTWFDRLRPVPRDLGCILPARIGPVVTFAFRDARGRTVARAVAGDTESVLTGCDLFRVAVGGRSTRVVGGEILLRVERLLGLNFEPQRSTTPPALRCPARPPQPDKADAPQSSLLVRGYANRLTLCRYGALGADAYPVKLERHRQVVDASTIADLTHELNALRRVGKGRYACPMDNGGRILLIFGYPDGLAERVLVSPNGCRFASNGRTSRWATPRLLHRLDALLAS